MTATAVMPAHARGCGLPRASSVAARPLAAPPHGAEMQCRVAALQPPEADGPVPAWAHALLQGVKQLGQDVKEQGQEIKQLGQDVKQQGQEFKQLSQEVIVMRNDAASQYGRVLDIMGTVMEVAAADRYNRLGIRGTGTYLRSVDDVLRFVLPSDILIAVALDRSGIREVITARLLHQDSGVLKAIAVLLKSEGMDEEAAEVEQVLLSGSGISAVPCAEAQPSRSNLRTVQRCLSAAASRAKAKGLGEDIQLLFRYCKATSMQERQELMEQKLFVRCVAATLLGAYTGVLEVDAGAGVGCEVDDGADALRLRTGETKLNAAMDAASEQQLALFMVSAFTLDKVLAAARAPPAASQAQAVLSQLPRRFIMDGICVYARTATQQQRQGWHAAPASARRTVADETVLSARGLLSAVLQMRFVNARHAPL